MARSTRSLATLLTTVVLAFSGRPAPAEEAAPFQLERLLPADTMAVLSIPDVTAIDKVAERTAIAKILADDEVADFLAPLLEQGQKRLDELKKDEGVDVVELLSCLRGQVAIALVDIDHSSGSARPKLVLAIDARENRERLHAFLERGKAALRSGDETLEFSERKRAGIDVTSVTDAGMTVEAAFLGSACVLTLHPDATNALIDAYTGGLEGSLAASPRWRASMKPATGPGVPLLCGYVNLGRIFEKYGSALGPAKPWLEESGILGIEAVTLTTTIDGADFVDRIHVHAPGEARGIFKLVPSEPLSDELLRKIPADAMYAAAGRTDLGGLWDEAFRIIAACDGDLHAEISRAIAGFEKGLGLSIRKDLVGSIGSDVVVYATPPKGGGPFPELVFDLQLKDRAAFEAAAAKLLAWGQEASGGEFEVDELEFRGQTIHYVRFEEGVPITPSYAFLDDHLVVALFPNTIKSLIRRRGTAKGEATSILDSEAFRAARAKLPRASSSVEYYDLPALFEFGYNLLMPILQAADSSIPKDIPLSMAMLPSAEAISRHLTPVIAGGKADESGMTITISSPVPFLPIVASAAVGSSVFFLSAASEAPVVEIVPAPGRDVGRAAKADPECHDLDQIGAALLIHYVRHDKTYPKGLHELVESAPFVRRALRSSKDASPTKVGDVEISYDYVGPDVARLDASGRDVDATKIVVAWSRTAPRAVLFLNGSTRRVEEKEFVALLEATRTAIESAGSK